VNAYRCLCRNFASAFDQTFLEWDGGGSFTYGDLERETARVATLLTGLGLTPGDWGAPQIDKYPQGRLLCLGCLRAGLAFLPLNTAYQRDELEFFLRDAEPRAAPARFDDAPAGEGDLAVIVYTSGTTGRPKGAMVSRSDHEVNGVPVTNPQDSPVVTLTDSDAQGTRPRAIRVSCMGTQLVEEQGGRGYGEAQRAAQWPGSRRASTTRAGKWCSSRASCPPRASHARAPP
jgi:acyl-CoA synthetase (AMP-forming)/AMP-acid ligase II